jgi:hypothetical protein
MEKEEFIARVRHIGWVAFQIAAGQAFNDQPNEDQMASLLNGVRFALANPNMTPEENHENWMRTKLSQGWCWGPIKDFVKKEHPDLVPFGNLPLVEQRKDIMDGKINDLATQLYDLMQGKAVT